MAILKNGLSNGFNGTIGMLEGYTRNGQWIVRARRAKSSKPPTDRQLAVREKMKLVNNLLRCCAEFVNIGYAEAAHNKTYLPYNAAVSYHLKHAVYGNYPDIKIDYTKVKLSQGNISLEELHIFTSLDNNVITINWIPVTIYPRSTDHIMVLAYAPATNQTVFNLCGAKAVAGYEQLVLPVDMARQNIHTYIAFREENGIKCSSTEYQFVYKPNI
jgi:hypothetical protein